MKILKVFCVLYGASALATFAWLFLRLSGASACAAGWETCGSVAGSAAALALTWPAYWGALALGAPLATRSISLLGSLALLLAFAALVVFTLAWDRLQRREPE